MKCVSSKVRNGVFRAKRRSEAANDPGFPSAEKKPRLSLEISLQGVKLLPQVCTGHKEYMKSKGPSRIKDIFFYEIRPFSVFYGRRIPTEVFSLCRRKKIKNKNLLAGCRREIRFNRNPTDSVDRPSNFLECRRKK